MVAKVQVQGCGRQNYDSPQKLQILIPWTVNLLLYSSKETLQMHFR